MGKGVETSRKHNERQKHCEKLGKGGSKLFELYLLVEKTTMKGWKLFETLLADSQKRSEAVEAL